MSSAPSISPMPSARGDFDRRHSPLHRKMPASLRGQFAGIAENVSPELAADIGSALADRKDGPFRRSALVGTLFRSAFPTRTGGAPTLQPIFAAEALSRARTMFALVLMLEEKSWSGDEPWYPDVSPMRLSQEITLAKHLVELLETLALESGADPLPCDRLLRGILAGFTELFGPGIGQLSFELEAETLALAGFKRRALVLAAADLINRSMLRSLPQPHSGQFRATLRRVAVDRGEFVLEHNGRNVELALPGEPSSVLAMMAALLEAELVFRRSATGGPAVEFRFPC